ncbi:UNVERIFIED_CONTAM: hypothetical protein GTU68_014123 [Idotea baltica]|nr:hypothetical protein [Idotea baltica]
MLTITGRHKLHPIVEHSGHSSPSINSWKLDCTSLKFPLKGALPYCEAVQARQTDLLRHVFRQPYSKEMISTMLDLQKKQRYYVLEELIGESFIESLEECAAFDANYAHTHCARPRALRTTPTGECRSPLAPLHPLMPPCSASAVTLLSLLIYSSSIN